MKTAGRRFLPHPCWRPILSLMTDQTGAIAVEYGLIAALIAVVLIGSLTRLGETLVGLPLQSVINAMIGALS
jgi:Flp pilus assembly pilin Flp